MATVTDSLATTTRTVTSARVGRVVTAVVAAFLAFDAVIHVLTSPRSSTVRTSSASTRT